MEVKIKGRKRHLLVDTMGLLLAVVVTSVAVQDRDGARLLFSRLSGCCKKLRLIWADGGYRLRNPFKSTTRGQAPRFLTLNWFRDAGYQKEHFHG